MFTYYLYGWMNTGSDFIFSWGFCTCQF